jgi:hypothetical protein
MPDREATYFYCLLQARQTPRLGRAARGLPHTGRPRLLDAGQGLWLVVGDAPLGHYSGERIERKLSDLEWISACAMAHERVIEDAARSGTVIPMKLFTLFANDERALTHISRARRKLDKLLKRVADRAEWGVRLTLDENRARRGESARARRQASGLGAGTSFLVRKQQERQAAHRLVAEARAAAERVYVELSRHADESRRQTPAQADGRIRVLLDAAFLVRSRGADRFRAAARAAGRRLDGQGLALVLSGPWPPYTFVAEPA